MRFECTYNEWGMFTAARNESALLIDDDVELCSMLKDYLGRHGWTVASEHSADSGLKAAINGHYSIVLLDVMLPDFDGFELLRRLRRESQVNVLLLTARGDDVDRIVGLEVGADDYLPKPFNPRELVARMRAITRRGAQQVERETPKKRTNVAGFTVDDALRQISYESQRLDLSDLEYLLMARLLDRPFEIVPREELVEQVLERPFRPLDRSIDMHISRLRRKLEALPGFGGGIRAIRNSGYMFSPSSEGSA